MQVGGRSCVSEAQWSESIVSWYEDECKKMKLRQMNSKNCLQYLQIHICNMKSYVLSWKRSIWGTE